MWSKKEIHYFDLQFTLSKHWADMTERATELVKAILAR